MKICNICGIEKPLDEFTNTKYKGEVKKRPTCKKCTTLRVKEWVNNNKEKRSEYVKNYSKENKEHINNKSRIYYYNNTKKVIDYNVSYKRNRRLSDDLFRLSDNIRKSISKSFANKNNRKNIKSELILGCTFKEFKLYIESKFESWMTWENYGLYNGRESYGWDLDHIIPIASAKTEEEIIKLNHFTNFQPLCSYINRNIKRGRV